MAASVSLSTAEVASSSTRIGGVAEDGAGDGEPLALAAGELLAALADDRVVAVGEGLDERRAASASVGGPPTSSSVASGRP